MGDTMTPEQLAAIAARNAARTPGKWTQHLVDDTTVVCRGQDICCTFPGGGLDGDVDFNTDTEQRELDAAFIAHASEDIPALLAEVARLTAALAEAESVNSEFSWEYAAQIAERFGVNESDRRKFGNEMAEVFRAMGAP